jgi:glycosyltransferase involved in cell wall biosynthesis
VTAVRIVWVKVGGLWPLNTGGRIRSFHILSELSRRHRVTLLGTHGPNDDPDGLAAHLPACERVVSVPHTLPKRGGAAFGRALVRSWLSPYPVDLWRCRVPRLREEVERATAAGAADLCVADFLAAAPNVPIGGGALPTVLFAHNVEHMIWKRLAEVEGRGWRRFFLEIEWRKMRRYEARVCALARLTVAVSEVDRALLAALAPRARIRATPTGVDTRYFAPNGGPAAATGIVFTGSMDWFPNEDAILYFIEAMLPMIRREAPGTPVTVVGRNPTPRLRAAAERAGLTLTGTVDDVRPYMAEAAVYMVPLRVGGGTRLKIFEALAMGKAVVSTAVGAEGLPLEHGRHFLQADAPADFARSVVELLRDPARRQVLGGAGRRLVVERYSWAQVAEEFERRCSEVMPHHAD